MNYDDLYSLYWIQTEWNKVLSDREIFAEEPLNVEGNTTMQESVSYFSEWDELVTETTKIDNLSSLNIQQKETPVDSFDVSLNQPEIIENKVQENEIDFFEYPLQDIPSTENNHNSIQEQQNIEETKLEEKEELLSWAENNQFREAINKQAWIKVERPKINVIASQSNEVPIETLMWVQKKEEVAADTNENWYQNLWNYEENNLYNQNKVSEHHAVLNPFKGANVFSEIKIFIVLFFTVFSTFFFFTNAKLVMITVNDFIGNSWDNQVSLITEEHNTAAPISHTQEKLAGLEESFQKIQKYKREEQDIALNMQDFLNQQQEAHLLNFNTLPPTNRLIVPDLDINVPLIDIPSMWEEDFENGNFDEELMNWVVKYPTTATPGSQGNSLIFWHSSSEWWKHNEYWFIFRNLPRLQPGQKIQVIWDGQLTTYEMIERKVVNPKDVWNYYHEFVRDWEYYLTLMGCYPIGSSSQRMMVVAKKVSN